MLQIGTRQTLTLSHTAPQGAYLCDPEAPGEQVLLPSRQVPEGAAKGDRIEVFLYRDSQDRMIATTKIPAAQIGRVSVLPVAQTTQIGAFLSWGLEKDLLLPFKEQTRRLSEGDVVPVMLYEDRSGRLCATMKLYPRLAAESGHRVGDRVSGVLYEIKKEWGGFVAVDGRFHGMIPAKEMVPQMKVGDTVTARVTQIKKDGKLSLSVREPQAQQLKKDAQVILDKLEEGGGTLLLCDASGPDEIRAALGMSKAGFKRACGHLLKEGKIRILEDRICRR